MHANRMEGRNNILYGYGSRAKPRELAVGALRLQLLGSKILHDLNWL